MKLANFKYALGFAVIAIPSCLLAWSAMSTLAEARLAAEESAQRALFVEVVDLLAAHHERHGHYPESLDTLDLTYPDGGNKATLASLTYESNGKHYSLVTKGISTNQEIHQSR